MSYFFEKIKIIFKKFFSYHFLTKKNPTSKWTFFSKKKLKFDFYMCFYIYVKYILCHNKLKKKKKFFSPFFNQKKSDLKMDIFFEKKIKI